MIDQPYPPLMEISIDSVIQDATALFEQYEPINDSVPAPLDDTCENLYAIPWC